MTYIQRSKIVTEQVEIPEGQTVCGVCKGAGMLSKYDEGTRSLMHMPALAAKKTCWRCGGQGYVKDGEVAA